MPVAPTIQEQFCLDTTLCYTFTIFDAAADGICCGFGLGDYNITDGAGNILLASNGQFLDSETGEFCLTDIISSTSDIGSAQVFKAYPNPTDGIFNLEVVGLEDAGLFLDIEVYNTAGQQVQKSKIGRFGDAYKGQVSLYHYPAGAYTIRFISDNITETLRVVRL